MWILCSKSFWEECKGHKGAGFVLFPGVTLAPRILMHRSYSVGGSEWMNEWVTVRRQVWSGRRKVQSPEKKGWEVKRAGGRFQRLGDPAWGGVAGDEAAGGPLGTWIRKMPFGIRLSFAACKSFPCGSAGKESARNAGDLASIPGLGRSPGEGSSYLLQYSGLENSMDSTVHGAAKSRTQLSDFHFHSG